MSCTCVRVLKAWLCRVLVQVHLCVCVESMKICVSLCHVTWRKKYSLLRAWNRMSSVVCVYMYVYPCCVLLFTEKLVCAIAIQHLHLVV